MTATDELRRLLDERGVEWQDYDGEPTWMGSDGEMHYARQEFTFNGLTDNVTVYHLAPEQAVEATLGRGTCHSDNNPPLLYDDPFRVFRCSECHHKVDLRRNPKPNYCPNCGRKVVDE